MLSVRRYYSSTRLLYAGFSSRISSTCSRKSNFVNNKGYGVLHILPQNGNNQVSKTASNNGLLSTYETFRLCHFYSAGSKRASSGYRKTEHKGREARDPPKFDKEQFQMALSQLLPRFKAEDLADVMVQIDNPHVCLKLFNWATQQPRFKHDICTFRIVVKKLGSARMYDELENVVKLLLALTNIGDEAIFNSIIYFSFEDHDLDKACDVFSRMRRSKKLECRPSIKTYNLMFSGLLSQGKNAYTNSVCMRLLKQLFRQMVVYDKIEPDLFTLNALIKGHVLACSINDALKILDEMGVVYKCLPDSLSYDLVIHGLCVEGMTKNARDMLYQMKSKGFVPCAKSYNSLVNALAMEGETDEAKKYLWEMVDQRSSVDFVTYKTLLDQVCRHGRLRDAVMLLKEFREKDLVDEHTYRKLLYVIEDDECPV